MIGLKYVCKIHKNLCKLKIYYSLQNTKYSSAKQYIFPRTGCLLKTINKWDENKIKRIRTFHFYATVVIRSNIDSRPKYIYLINIFFQNLNGSNASWYYKAKSLLFQWSDKKHLHISFDDAILISQSFSTDFSSNWSTNI